MPETDDPDAVRPVVEPISGLVIEVNIDPHLDVQSSVSRLSESAAAAAVARGFTTGEIGIRVTDDDSIRELNARHLNHDYETDVISFCYSCHGNEVVGELVVSADTASRRAGELGWSEQDELLLYVVHGVLHITGMEDDQPKERAQMRELEREVMLSLGIDQIVRFGADMACDQHSGSSSEATK